MLCDRCRKEMEPEERPDLSKLNLINLPFMNAVDYLELPKVPAVYFALAPGKICYIGNADDLFRRWRYHRNLSRALAESECRISWLIQSDRAQREQIEREAIRYFKPLWNNNGAEYMDGEGMSKHFPSQKQIRWERKCGYERNGDINAGPG